MKTIVQQTSATEARQSLRYAKSLFKHFRKHPNVQIYKCCFLINVEHKYKPPTTERFRKDHETASGFERLLNKFDLLITKIKRDFYCKENLDFAQRID